MTAAASSARRRWAALLLAALPLAALAACEDNNKTDDATVPATESAAAAETIATAPADVGGAAAVYTRIAPSLVRVTGDGGTATGVVVADGVVLTSATAVWPGASATVTPANGQAYAAVPVINVDPALDLAVLGPLPDAASTAVPPAAPAAGPRRNDTGQDKAATATAAEGSGPLPAVTFVNGEGLPIGNEVFLIGYMDGVDRPAIARGLLNGAVEWAPAALTFFLTDVATAGGPLGGVLATGSGDVIGFAGLPLAGGRFGLIPSAADLQGELQRLQEIPASTPAAATPPAATPATGVGLTATVLVFTAGELAHPFTFDAAAGAAVAFAVESSQTVGLEITDAAGAVLAQSQSADGRATLIYTPETAGTLTLTILNPADGVGPVDLTASVVLDVPPADTDDGAALTPGTLYRGGFADETDTDTFTLTLAAGQEVELTVGSLQSDPILAIMAPDGTPLASDNDSGRGPQGTDARITLTAAAAGPYTVAVSAADGVPGFYLLRVDSAPVTAADEETAETGASLEDRGTTLTVSTAAALPAAFGAAGRGIALADGSLVLQVVTVDAAPADGAAITVGDTDGIFQVKVSVVAPGVTRARVEILNAAGDDRTPAGGLAALDATCGASQVCLGALGLGVTDDADAGPWTVRLLPESGIILGWQIEVRRSDADLTAATIPAQ